MKGAKVIPCALLVLSKSWDIVRKEVFLNENDVYLLLYIKVRN